MGSIALAAALSVLALTSLRAQTLRASGEADQATLNRIRAALERPAPPSLLPVDRPLTSNATFRLQILEEQWFERNIPLPWQVEPMWRPRQLIPPGPFGTQPVVGVDLIWLGGAIVHGVQSIRRARAEATATEEVLQAIRDYCSAQPDGGAGIRICGS